MPPKNTNSAKTYKQLPDNAKKLKELRKRKLYRKIGAGFLAVTSLIGMAGSWQNKTTANSEPEEPTPNAKPTRNLETINNVKTNIVEQTIQSEVAAEMKRLNVSAQKQETRFNSKYNNTKSFIALTTWISSMVILTSSLLINSPLPLGYLLIGLLPGEPHTVDISLISSTKEVTVDGKFSVDIKVNSGIAKLKAIRTELEYNPDQLEIISINIIPGAFDNTVINSYDNEKGFLELERKLSDNTQSKKINSTIATVTFKAKAYIGSGNIVLLKRNAHPGINNKGCWAYINEGKSNLVSRTQNISLNIKPQSIQREIDTIKQLSQKITIDGALEDWGDSLDYTGFSLKSKGNIISHTDLIEGNSTQENDIRGTFTFGSYNKNLYISGMIIDDSVAEKDKIEINAGDKIWTMTLNDIQTNGNFKIKKIEGGYIFEAFLGAITDSSENFKKTINFKIFDSDSDGSNSINAFSY